MKIQSIPTKIVEISSCKLTDLIFESLPNIQNNSIIAITSKVVSLCEGSVIKKGSISKDEIIKTQADYFLPRSDNKYGVYLTIKNNMLIPSAGVDESNSNGYYILWPQNPQKTTNLCWQDLKRKYGINHLGIIITDSTSSPLRWGVTGKSIAFCGFDGVARKIGDNDLFGHKLKFTHVNVADAIASAAVLCMGESNEQTPIALIEDVPFIQFREKPPTKEELEALQIDIKDDLFAQFLEGADWKSRKSGN